MTLSAIAGKIPQTKKIVFHFLSIAYVATKPTDQSCSNSLSRVSLQISLAHVFNFQPTLKIKGSFHKEQAYELNDKHGVYKHDCFCCDVIQSAGDRQK